MLARLEGIPGVAEARADSSGRFFRIELRLSVTLRDVIERLREVLGPGAAPLDTAAARAQLTARDLGDRWLRASEVMTLSYVEGRILAVRIAAAAAAEIPALGTARAALEEAIRVELFATFERVHGEGGRAGSGWLYAEWPDLARAAIRRCAGALAADVEAELARRLPGMLRP